MYQFPLIETSKSANFNQIKSKLKKYQLVKGLTYNLSLYNEEAIIHKLSHQHLHTKFWIVEIDQLIVEGIFIKDITNYPVPVLINNFIEVFNF